MLDVENLRATTRGENSLAGGTEYVEVTPLLFQQVGGDGPIGFEKDAAVLEPVEPAWLPVASR